MADIKVILFDFDGTLVNSLPLIYESFRQVFKESGNGDMSDEDISLLFGPPEIPLIKQNISDKQKVDTAIETYYRTYAENHSRFISLSEDIREMLICLKGLRKHLGIVTSKGRKSLDISLDLLEIRDLFDVIISGEDVQFNKPHPEGIIKALEILGFSGENTVFVGDSDSDIEAGITANTVTVRVNWFNTDREKLRCVKADFEFDSVNEFKEHFNAILV